MSLTAIVRPSLERRRAILRCRFLIGAHHRPEHLERAVYEASQRFVDDMAKQGWEWLGRMALADGPFPATPIPTSIPKAPAKRKRRLGEPSSRDETVAATAAASVAALPTLLTTDTWEYELAGAFVRPLPPTELLASDAARFEARARKRAR